ncbi:MULTISPECIES: protoporphyrinogen oxidase [Protofrankia]|uniref:Coproporphyrinogen III oxidase n=1 Tax=Protofrankia coriariae TaxID=1562887 RepID=A0ABR5F544_9ACTN|nr:MULTISPECIES: protoporphyrinogen oxidase [Protofrankia]KLL11780.1 protoporphyrinogen oxidase [Protofrankia coriariae]ONH36712.1 protoporphyrinogen oxidase [Protofrankia sp. BMG5.30]
MRVVVVGAGVAGLAAAHALRGRAQVTVVEATDRVGGKLRTTPFEGLELEEGAESFLVRVPDAVRLARHVGLGHDIVHPATTSASLLISGRLRPLPPRTLLGVPTDVVGLLRSRVLSPTGLVRAAADLVLPRTPLPADPTVGGFVGARVGRQVVERLVDPLLGGVYAGRADAMSLRATVPQLTPIMSESRSLLLGAYRVRARTAPADPATTPVFASVRGGLGRFAAAVADASEAEILLGTRVRRLSQTAAGWRLSLVGSGSGSGSGPRAVPDGTSGDTGTSSGPGADAGPAAGPGADLGADLEANAVDGPGAWDVDADAVILAVPVPEARRLLSPVAPHVAAPLAAVPYTSVALITLLYRGVQLPPGSGYLVPPRQGNVMKAATFLSAKWPHLSADPGLSIVRASVGRAGDESDLERSDVELAGVVAAELAAATGLTARPLASRVTRWDAGLPQYLPGHLERTAVVRGMLPAGLALAGAGYDGVGIAACVRSGEAAAETVLRSDDAVRIGQ